MINKKSQNSKRNLHFFFYGDKINNIKNTPRKMEALLQNLIETSPDMLQTEAYRLNIQALYLLC